MIFLWKPAREMENAWSIVPLQKSMKLPITAEVVNVPGAGVRDDFCLEHAAFVKEQEIVDSVKGQGRVNFAMEKE